MAKDRSIRFLLLSALASAFMLVLVFTLMYGVNSQREQMEKYTRLHLHGMSKSYFDAVNTMMLAGTMANREMLREKMVAPEDVLDIRVIRSEALSKTFGPGLPSERAEDELDRRGMAGEQVESFYQGENGRVLTLIEPVRAVSNYQGVNCLTCHVVEEGTVLGVIRVDYSLAQADEELNTHLLINGSVQILLFIVAFSLTAWVLDHIVIKRLRRLHDSMGEIATNSDLSIQLEVGRDDEIGSVSRAFNRMMEQINHSMRTVVSNATQVYEAAQTIASKAETTEQEVLTQKVNTDQVAESTTELASSAEQVKGNAEETAAQSHVMLTTAGHGEAQAQAAVQGIEALSTEVQQGAARIEELNNRTDEVAAVLEVISSIAEQTNLLALNAAIEAARAGEQGRGFAVVADEVRSLASRTQESTGEIRQTIDALKHEASDCVQIMGQASEMAQNQVQAILAVSQELAQIAEAVRNISDLNEQMERAANAQNLVAETINGNVREISQSAEQTSNDAQQTARIAEQLLTMANALQETVGQFRLG